MVPDQANSLLSGEDVHHRYYSHIFAPAPSESVAVPPDYELKPIPLSYVPMD